MTDEAEDAYRVVARELRTAAGDPSRSFVLHLLEEEVGPERASRELPALLASLSKWNAWRYLNPKPGRVSTEIEERASGYRVVGGRRARFRTRTSKWVWLIPALMASVLAVRLGRAIWIGADEPWANIVFEVGYLTVLLVILVPMMRRKTIEATIDERALHVGTHRVERSDIRYLSVLAPRESADPPPRAHRESRAIVAATSEGVVELTGWIDRQTAIELCNRLEDELGLAEPRLRVEPVEERDVEVALEDEAEELEVEVDELTAREEPDVSRPG